MSALELNPQYVTDEKGQRIGVFVDMTAWERLMEELDELEDIRAFDEAMAGDLEALPLDEARTEIDKARAKLE